MNTFFVVQCCQARQCEKNNIFIILNNHSLLKCKLNKTLNALLQMNTFTWVWVRSWDSLFAGSTLLCKTVKKIKFKKMFWIVLELFDLWQWPVDSIRLWCSCLVPEDMAKPFFFFFFWCIGSTPLGQTTWLNSAPLWWTEVARICFPANCEQCVAMNQGQPPPRPQLEKHKAGSETLVSPCSSSECGADQQGKSYVPLESHTNVPVFRGSNCLSAVHTMAYIYIKWQRTTAIFCVNGLCYEISDIT